MDAGWLVRWKWRAGFVLVLALLATPAAGEKQLAHPGFHIVGYLPDYQIEQFDARTTRHLTDLIFFSVKPEPKGNFTSKVLESPRTIALLKQIRDDQHVKLQLCIGGWDRSQGFVEISATADSRRQFAQGLRDYCRQHGFDGADIDWEHPQNDAQITNYGLMLAEIAQQFKPFDLRLTVAMAGWQRMTDKAIEAVDAFHLMSYDAPQKHSTLVTAEADVQRLIDAGVPRSKIRLGVPFYGRRITQPDQVKTYAEIVAKQSKPLNLNQLNSDEIDGIYFNGPATIRAKTRFAKEQKLNGIMIWELGQDAAGNDSLLNVIWETAK